MKRFAHNTAAAVAALAVVVFLSIAVAPFGAAKTGAFPTPVQSAVTTQTTPAQPTTSTTSGTWTITVTATNH